jgi:hypothetical protein
MPSHGVGGVSRTPTFFRRSISLALTRAAAGFGPQYPVSRPGNQAVSGARSDNCAAANCGQRGGRRHALACPPQKCPHSFDELGGGTRGDSNFKIFKDTSASPPGFEVRAAACSRRPVSLGRNMSKRNRTVFDEGSVEAMGHLREQDEKFCQALRAAIQGGRESRPTGVSTEPCTQRPILNYTRPD